MSSRANKKREPAELPMSRSRFSSVITAVREHIECGNTRCKKMMHPMMGSTPNLMLCCGRSACNRCAADFSRANCRFCGAHRPKSVWNNSMAMFVVNLVPNPNNPGAFSHNGGRAAGERKPAGGLRDQEDEENSEEDSDYVSESDGRNQAMEVEEDEDEDSAVGTSEDEEDPSISRNFVQSDEEGEGEDEAEEVEDSAESPASYDTAEEGRKDKEEEGEEEEEKKNEVEEEEEEEEERKEKEKSAASKKRKSRSTHGDEPPLKKPKPSDLEAMITPSATSRQRKAEEKKKEEEAQRATAEKKKKAESDRLQKEAEQKRKEETRQAEEREILAHEKRREEEKKRAEERARVAEEKRREEEKKRAEEQARLAEEKHREEERKKKADEEKRLAEEKRREEEKKKEEARLKAREEKKKADEEKKKEEARKKKEEEARKKKEEEDARKKKEEEEAELKARAAAREEKKKKEQKKSAEPPKKSGPHPDDRVNVPRIKAAVPPPDSAESFGDVSFEGGAEDGEEATDARSQKPAASSVVMIGSKTFDLHSDTSPGDVHFLIPGGCTKASACLSGLYELSSEKMPYGEEGKDEILRVELPRPSQLDVEDAKSNSEFYISVKVLRAGVEIDAIEPPKNFPINYRIKDASLLPSAAARAKDLDVRSSIITNAIATMNKCVDFYSRSLKKSRALSNDPPCDRPAFRFCVDSDVVCVCQSCHTCGQRLCEISARGVTVHVISHVHSTELTPDDRAKYEERLKMIRHAVRRRTHEFAEATHYVCSECYTTARKPSFAHTEAVKRKICYICANACGCTACQLASTDGITHTANYTHLE